MHDPRGRCPFTFAYSVTEREGGSVKCGKELIPEDRFCGSCGTPVANDLSRGGRDDAAICPPPEAGSLLETGADRDSNSDGPDSEIHCKQFRRVIAETPKVIGQKSTLGAAFAQGGLPPCPSRADQQLIFPDSRKRSSFPNPRAHDPGRSSQPEIRHSRLAHPIRSSRW